MSSKQEVIVLGAGGHAKVCLNTIVANQSQFQLAGYVATEPTPEFSENFDISYLGDDEEFLEETSKERLLVNGLGQTSKNNLRKEIFEKYKENNFKFLSFEHASAVYPSDKVNFEEGVQLMASSSLQTGVSIGSNSILNTGAIVDHDCSIGKNSHIAPGAVLCGEVSIQNDVHVGAGAVILEGVNIGESTIIGAGSVIVNDLKARKKVAGNPAKSLKNESQ